MSLEIVLKPFLTALEGFSPNPFWDFKQWSWGYGTAAGFNKNVKPAGTITKDKAWKDAFAYVEKDKAALAKSLKVQLTPSQWAALLSFSYNLGLGNAQKLVPVINSGNIPQLKDKWLSYINAGGKPNAGLIKRRKDEWNLYSQTPLKPVSKIAINTLGVIALSLTTYFLTR